MSSGDLQLDLTTIEAEAVIDDDGVPALVIRSADGLQHVELSGGAHPVEAVAGGRRITEAVWNFIMMVKTRELQQPAAPRSGPGNSGPGR